MKINWKVRFSNPVFVSQIVLAVFMPVLAYLGITFEDLTTWGSLFDVLLEAVSNPFVLGLVIVSVYNAVIDPTVKGISDSRQALTYHKPKNDKDYL